MQALKLLALVPGVVLLSAGSALGQSASQTGAGAPWSGYMTVTAGATLADTSAPAFGLEIAEHISRRVQAYATFMYFDNLFNDAAQSDLIELDGVLTGLTGSSWEFHGRDQGLAFSGGAKYLLSDGPTARPYVGAGVGVLNISRTVREASLGDVTDPVLAVFGAPDGVIDASLESTFKPMAEFVAGIGFSTGRTYVDVGYRFRQVFRTGDRFTFSQFGVGIGMRF
jgi:hypothetical protein